MLKGYVGVGQVHETKEEFLGRGSKVKKGTEIVERACGVWERNKRLARLKGRGRKSEWQKIKTWASVGLLGLDVEVTVKEET